MAKDIIRYKISTDPLLCEDGEQIAIDEIAYTSAPAIMLKGMAYQHIKKEMQFADSKKFRIVAPALIPDLPIYRNDEELGEYEVVFEKDVIEDLFMKLGREGKKDLFNQEHNQAMRAPSFILEKWMVGDDPKADRAYSQFGLEVPSGTIMLITQFDDKELYNELVDKGMTGFSIEGLFGLKLSEIIKKEKMEENKMMLPDGEHTIGEKIYVIKDGAVTEIKDVVKEEMAEDVKKEEETAIVEDAAEDIADKEIKKEELADAATDKVEEEIKKEEMAIDPIVDEEAILMIVQPKLDELIGMISELKSMIEESKNDEEIEVEDIAMRKSQKMSIALNSLFGLDK